MVWSWDALHPPVVLKTLEKYWSWVTQLALVGQEVISQLAASLWNPQVHQQRLVHVHHHQLQHLAHTRSCCRSHILLGWRPFAAAAMRRRFVARPLPLIWNAAGRACWGTLLWCWLELMAFSTSSLKSLSVGEPLSQRYRYSMGRFHTEARCCLSRN